MFMLPESCACKPLSWTTAEDIGLEVRAGAAGAGAAAEMMVRGLEMVLEVVLEVGLECTDDDEEDERVGAEAAVAGFDGDGVGDELSFGNGPYTISDVPFPCASRPLSMSCSACSDSAAGAVDLLYGCGLMLITLMFSADKALFTKLIASASRLLLWVAAPVGLSAVVILVEVVFGAEPRIAFNAATLGSSRPLLSCDMRVSALACGEAVLVARGGWIGDMKLGF